MQGREAPPIGVFWDFENAQVPTTVDPFQVVSNIKRGLRQAGLKGLIYIVACGNTAILPHKVQQGLHKAGIVLRHVPLSEKEAEDETIMLEIGQWEHRNFPPANILLISGDVRYSEKLHMLDMSGYNVLLACPSGVAVPLNLRHAASTVWDWPRLAAGELTELPRRHTPTPPSTPTITPPTTTASTTTALPPPNIPTAVKLRLRQALANHPDGILMSQIKPFLEADNHPLNLKSMGCSKLKDLLAALPEIAEIRIIKTETGHPPLHSVHLAPSLLKNTTRHMGTVEQLNDSSSTIWDWPRLAAGELTELPSRHTPARLSTSTINPPTTTASTTTTLTTTTLLPAPNIPTEVKHRLHQALANHPDGILMSQIKPFLEADNQPLNLKSMGCSKLKDLLAALPEIAEIRTVKTETGHPPLHSVHLPPSLLKKTTRQKATVEQLDDSSSPHTPAPPSTSTITPPTTRASTTTTLTTTTLLPAPNIPNEVKHRLCQTLASHPDGILMSQIKPFLESDNQSLDLKSMGFSKLKDLLTALPEIAEIRTVKTETGHRALHSVHLAPSLLNKTARQMAAVEHLNDSSGKGGGADRLNSPAPSTVWDGPRLAAGKLTELPRRHTSPLPSTSTIVPPTTTASTTLSPQNIPTEFKHLLRQTLANHPDGILLSQIKPFLEPDNQSLNIKSMGLPTLKNLLAALPDIAEIRKIERETGQPPLHSVHLASSLLNKTTRQTATAEESNDSSGKGGRADSLNSPAPPPPSVSRSVRRRLREVVEKHPEGLLMCSLRGLMEAEGRTFDPREIGFPKLRAFLNALPDIAEVRDIPRNGFPTLYVFPASQFPSQRAASASASSASASSAREPLLQKPWSLSVVSVDGSSARQLPAQPLLQTPRRSVPPPQLLGIPGASSASASSANACPTRSQTPLPHLLSSPSASSVSASSARGWPSFSGPLPPVPGATAPIPAQVLHSPIQAGGGLPAQPPIFLSASSVDASSADASSPRPVPRAVKNVLRWALRESPEGALTNELLLRLKMEGNGIDYKGLGYGKFVTLLRSIPEVVRVAVEPIPGRGSNVRYRLFLTEDAELLHMLRECMQSLRTDMLKPSQSNVLARLRELLKISTCLLGPLSDASICLSTGLSRGLLVKHSADLFGDGTTHDFYLSSTDQALWPCVFPNDPRDLYSAAQWAALQSFLESEEGREAFTASTGRHGAACIIKERGPAELRQMPLAAVTHMLQLSITQRNWVTVRKGKMPWKVVVNTPLELLPPSTRREDAGIRPTSAAASSPPRTPSDDSIPALAPIAAAANGDPAAPNALAQTIPCQPLQVSTPGHTDTMGDLRELLAEILPLFPNGLPCDCVKAHFLTHLGYALDQRALGHRNLRSLFETMPDIVRLQLNGSDLVLFPQPRTPQQPPPPLLNSPDSPLSKGVDSPLTGRSPDVCPDANFFLSRWGVTESGIAAWGVPSPAPSDMSRASGSGVHHNLPHPPPREDLGGSAQVSDNPERRAIQETETGMAGEPATLPNIPDKASRNDPPLNELGHGPSDPDRLNFPSVKAEEEMPDKSEPATFPEGPTDPHRLVRVQGPQVSGHVNVTCPVAGDVHANGQPLELLGSSPSAFHERAPRGAAIPLPHLAVGGATALTPESASEQEAVIREREGEGQEETARRWVPVRRSSAHPRAVPQLLLGRKFDNLFIPVPIPDERRETPPAPVVEKDLAGPVSHLHLFDVQSRAVQLPGPEPISDSNARPPLQLASDETRLADAGESVRVTPGQISSRENEVAGSPHFNAGPLEGNPKDLTTLVLKWADPADASQTTRPEASAPTTPHLFPWTAPTSHISNLASPLSTSHSPGLKWLLQDNPHSPPLIQGPPLLPPPPAPTKSPSPSKPDDDHSSEGSWIDLFPSILRSIGWKL